MSNTGGPAFPVPDIDGSAVAEGMTLRDYFAAKAMQAEFMGGVAQYDFGVTAERAYMMADAMLAAREQK